MIGGEGECGRSSAPATERRLNHRDRDDDDDEMDDGDFKTMTLDHEVEASSFKSDETTCDDFGSAARVSSKSRRRGARLSVAAMRWGGEEEKTQMLAAVGLSIGSIRGLVMTLPNLNFEVGQEIGGNVRSGKRTRRLMEIWMSPRAAELWSGGINGRLAWADL